jgi:hypothetical protein
MRSLYLVLYRGITYPTFLRCSNITEQRRGEIPCPEPRKVELVGAAGTDVDIINISGHNPIPASLLDQVLTASTVGSLSLVPIQPQPAYATIWWACFLWKSSAIFWFRLRAGLASGSHEKATQLNALHFRASGLACSNGGAGVRTLCCKGT